MDIATFNYFEAGLWFGIGGVLSLAAFIRRKRTPNLNVIVVASIAFMAFGVSDLIEAQTGAWWNPPALLVLKGSCLLVFFWCYRRIRKNRA